MSGVAIPAKWLLAGFLGLGAALNYADRAAMSAVLAAVRTEFGLSDVALGLLGSVFLWSYAIASPLAGRLADRRARRGLVLWSIALWSLVTALIGAASNFSSLVALRFLLGLAESLFLPAAVALVAEAHGASTRARAMSFITIGVNAGMVLGGGFTGTMAEHYGWRSGFWALGLAGIVLALLGRGFVRGPTTTMPQATDAPSFWAAVRFLASVRSYRVLLLESLLSGFGMWMFFGWMPLYLRETYNMSLGMAGFAGTFVLQGAVMLGIFVGGWLSDRVSADAPHRRMLLYGVFYLLAAPFLLVFLGRPGFPLLAAGIAAFSFLRGLGQANDNPTQCEIVPQQFRATGLGVMNAISTAAGGSGVLLAGFLKSHVGLAAVFAGVAGVFAIAGVALVTGYRFWLRADIARAQQLENSAVRADAA
jgi:predicted MFS family arabinose efflux permease